MNSTSGQMIPAEPAWRRSTFCASGSCVEAADVPDGVLVQDSKLDSSPRLAFGKDSWRTFIEAVKTGELGPGK